MKNWMIRTHLGGGFASVLGLGAVAAIRQGSAKSQQDPDGTRAIVKTCCEYHADAVPDGCRQGRDCPAARCTGAVGLLG